MNTRNFFLTVSIFSLVLSGLLGQEVQRINVSPGETLSLKLRTGGSVHVEVWDQNAVEVGIQGSGACRDCDITIEPDSDGVRVTSNYPRRRNESNNISFDIRLPRKFNIRLDSMGGGLDVTGLDGTIAGKTMGGAFHFEQLRGEVDLTTMGGDVTLRDSEVDGRITTMGGRVLFERVRGDVKGKSMGGQVIYRNVENPRNGDESVGEEVHIETMGGEIRVQDAPHGARVRTMGGDIEIGSAREFVEATTYGGDISVDSAEGDIELKTYSGDIRLNVTGDAGDIDVSTLQGRILIELPSSFSGTIEVDLSFTRNSRRNYQIRSDFPMEIEKDENWDYSLGFPRQVRYGISRVGSGKSWIRLKAINGNIEIRKK